MKTKRAFKAIIAMALSLILSMGALTSAFAAGSDEIVWSVDDETVTCTYHSALKEGTNTVAIEERDYYYFDISGLENGYYSVEITDGVFEYFALPEKSGGKYIGWGDGEYIGGVDNLIFNRKENVDVAVVGTHGLAESITIEVEYLGEDIESIDFSGENYNELLLHYDIIECWYQSETEYITILDAVVTFTGGKTAEFENRGFFFTCEDEIIKGENTMTFEFAGYEAEQVLNVAYITDYISGVEIKVPENATAYVYYDGTNDISEFDFEEVTVCFADCTKQTYEFDYCLPVTLPGGREIELDIFYGEHIDTHEVYLSIGAGCYEIDVIELNSKKASLKKNLELLTQQINFETESLKSDFERFFSLISNGGLTGFSHALNHLIDDIRWHVTNIAYEAGAFIAFVF